MKIEYVDPVGSHSKKFVLNTVRISIIISFKRLKQMNVFFKVFIYSDKAFIAVPMRLE